MASKHRTSAVLLAALVCGLLAMSTRADTCGCMASNRSRSSYADIIRQTSPVLASEYPLHNATAEWNFAAMEQALKDGADINGKTPRGTTPLHVALYTTSHPYWHPYTEQVYKAVKMLLGKGADPNIPFPSASSQPGRTPLMWAAYDGRAELVRVLLKHGAEVNKAGVNGTTALHEAAQCDFRLSFDPNAAATVKLLLAYGADANATNARASTAFKVTPGYPDCAGAYSDRSDCPETCQALRDGVSEQQAEAIRAGGSPFNATISAKKCCSDPSSGNADSDARSLCCV